MTDAQFTEIHAKLGDAPALPGQEGFEAYKTALREVRTIVMDAYDFAAANQGDDDGEGGW